MLKEFALLKRHPFLSHQQFRMSWSAADTALPADRGHPGPRHVRNIIDATANPVFAKNAYDGIAEWWHGDEQPAANNRARFDGLYVDLQTSASVLALEIRILDRGGGKVKFMSLLKRKADLSPDEFSRYWATKHAQLVQTVPEVCQYFRRYVQNHCIPGSGERVDGTRCEVDIDGIVEIWFDSLSDLENAMTSRRYMEVLRPDEAKFVALPNIRLLALEEAAVAE